MSKHTITIGIPDAVLSPNARSHWAKVSAAKKSLRRKVVDVITIMHPKLVDKRWESATIQYHFYFPDRRRRDDDNFAARMKAARDALGQRSYNKNGLVNGVGAGVVADDCGFTQLPTIMGYDKDNPRVEIHIERTDTTTEGTK